MIATLDIFNIIGLVILAGTMVAYGKWDISLSRDVLRQWRFAKEWKSLRANTGLFSAALLLGTVKRWMPFIMSRSEQRLEHCEPDGSDWERARGPQRLSGMSNNQRLDCLA
jgi:hypothetical protein